VKFVCFASLQELPEGAESLFAEASKYSVFFSRAWFENLVGTVLENDQVVLLACVVDDNNVLAVLPLLKRGNNDISALTHLYSSLYSLLLGNDNQQAVLECLVQGLRQLPFDSLRLGPVAEDDMNMQLLQQAMKADGFQCYRNFSFYNWIYQVAGRSFSEYMTERPAKLRNTIIRKQRKLAREHNYSIRLYTEQDIDQGVADYQAVYKASWKAAELFDDFILGLAHRLSAQGWLRLAVLYIDQQPAAAQFWFVVHNKASIFKLAYDEAWKYYSPGSILLAYMMERVIDTDKVEEIDFLTGNDAYKRDWMSKRRERLALFCGKPPQPVGKTRQFTAFFKKLWPLN
jgi:hypothetical protein